MRCHAACSIAGISITKRAPPPGLGSYLSSPPHSLRDSSTQMKPKPRPLTFHSGCKEGVEDPMHDIRRNAGPVVGDRDGDLLIHLPKLDPDVLGA